MLENSTTQDFSIEHAVCFEKQLQTTQADLYGGETNNWPEASVMGVIVTSRENRNLMRMEG
jgi:hypothetical protein